MMQSRESSPVNLPSVSVRVSIDRQPIITPSPAPPSLPPPIVVENYKIRSNSKLKQIVTDGRYGAQDRVPHSNRNRDVSALLSS